MSEFRKVESARRSPTKCAFCGAHEGPFIDPQVEIPVYGQIYVCAATGTRSGCVRQMARLDNLVDPDEVMAITAELVAAQARISELEALVGSRKASVGELLEALGVK